MSNKRRYIWFVFQHFQSRFYYKCGNDLTLSNFNKVLRAKLLSHVFIFDTVYRLTKKVIKMYFQVRRYNLTLS